MQVLKKLDTVSFMDTDVQQLILIGVIVVLAITLVVLGVQIFFLLKQSSETIKKVNKILDGASGIVGNAALFQNPLVKLLIGTALAFFSGQKKIKVVKEITETSKPHKTKVEKVRRFFRRSL